MIGRREAYNAENAGSHRLWLNVGGSAGHSGCWALNIEEGSRTDQHGRRWEVSVSKASAAIVETIQEREATKAARDDDRAARRIEADAEKLLMQYRRKPEGDTAKSIRDAVGMSGTRFSPANQKLIDDGLIEPCHVKKTHTGGTRIQALLRCRDWWGCAGTNPTSPGMFCGGGTIPP